MAQAELVVIKNNFKNARISPEGLERAALAGGMVIETRAKINAERVFSDNATQALAGSIQTVVVSKTANSVRVSTGPTVVYGRIQELGGVIKPVIAKMLHWVDDMGNDIFAKRVKIPARPYLRPAVDQHRPEIENAVSVTLENEISRGL